jgi:hypothetical protein
VYTLRELVEIVLRLVGKQRLLVPETRVPEYTDDYGRKVYDYYDVSWR